MYDHMMRWRTTGMQLSLRKSLKRESKQTWLRTSAEPRVKVNEFLTRCQTVNGNTCHTRIASNGGSDHMNNWNICRPSANILCGRPSCAALTLTLTLTMNWISADSLILLNRKQPLEGGLYLHTSINGTGLNSFAPVRRLLRWPMQSPRHHLESLGVVWFRRQNADRIA